MTHSSFLYFNSFYLCSYYKVAALGVVDLVAFPDVLPPHVTSHICPSSPSLHAFPFFSLSSLSSLPFPVFLYPTLPFTLLFYSDWNKYNTYVLPTPARSSEQKQHVVDGGEHDHFEFRCHVLPYITFTCLNLPVPYSHLPPPLLLLYQKK